MHVPSMHERQAAICGFEANLPTFRRPTSIHPHHYQLPSNNPIHQSEGYTPLPSYHTPLPQTYFVLPSEHLSSQCTMYTHGQLRVFTTIIYLHLIPSPLGNGANTEEREGPIMKLQKSLTYIPVFGEYYVEVYTLSNVFSSVSLYVCKAYKLA